MQLSSIPLYPTFRKLKLSDKPMIDAYNKEVFVGDLTFSNLYDWRINDIPTKISRFGKNLVILTCDVSLYKDMIWIVSKNPIRENLRTIFRNKINNITIQENIFSSDKKFLSERYQVEEDLNNFEYVSSTDELSLLKGGKFRQLRSDLTQFKKKYDSKIKFEVTSLNKNKIDLYIQVDGLFNRWESYKKINEKISENERQSLYRLLIHNKYYKLFCLKAYDKDKLVGFATIELFPEHSTGLVAYLKTDKAYDGLTGEMVFRISNFLKDNEIKYLNYEQDLGIPSLKKFKMKFGPDHFITKYTLSKKN